MTPAETTSRFKRKGSVPSIQVVTLVLAVFLLPSGAQTASVAGREDLQARLVRHLAVLGMKLPHYKAEKLTPQEALKLVWKTALQEEPVFAIHVADDPATKDAKISLDLADVSCVEILRYVSELSASYWQLRGWSGNALTLSLKEPGSGPGEFHVVGKGFPLGTKGAALLGLRQDMKPAEVMNALSGFGVTFDPKLDEVAGYDAKHEVLVVAIGVHEAGFVGSLVRLANAGMKIEKPAEGNE